MGFLLCNLMGSLVVQLEWMIAIIEYGQNLVELLHFDSFVAMKILLCYNCFNEDVFTLFLYGTRLNLRYLKTIHFLHSCYHPEITGYILKKCTKSKCACLLLMTVKIRLKMNNRSHRYDINRFRPRHGHKCTKYKMYLSMMMIIYIKQNLINIWNCIHEKVEQHWV